MTKSEILIVQGLASVIKKAKYGYELWALFGPYMPEGKTATSVKGEAGHSLILATNGKQHSFQITVPGQGAVIYAEKEGGSESNILSLHSPTARLDISETGYSYQLFADDQWNTHTGENAYETCFNIFTKDLNHVLETYFPAHLNFGFDKQTSLALLVSLTRQSTKLSHIVESLTEVDPFCFPTRREFRSEQGTLIIGTAQNGKPTLSLWMGKEGSPSFIDITANGEGTELTFDLRDNRHYPFRAIYNKDGEVTIQHTADSEPETVTLEKADTAARDILFRVLTYTRFATN